LKSASIDVNVVSVLKADSFLKNGWQLAAVSIRLTRDSVTTLAGANLTGTRPRCGRIASDEKNFRAILRKVIGPVTRAFLTGKRYGAVLGLELCARTELP